MKQELDQLLTSAVKLGDDRVLEIQEAYCAALGELNDYINGIELQKSAQHSDLPTTGNHASTAILPKIELPKFDGNFTKWLPFKDIFTSCVVNDSCLTDVQRLHYLRCSLTGDAEAILRNFAVTENNFKRAWDMVRRRYDSKRRLVHLYIRDLLSSPSVSSESAAAMRRLIDTVTESTRALRTIGCPIQHWDDWLVALVNEKLDKTTLREWEVSLHSADTLPKLADMIKFLEARTRGLEVSIKQKTSQQSVRAHQTNLVKCMACDEKHLLYACPQFKTLQTPQKLEIIKRNKLCWNCLRPNHRINECDSKAVCQTCHQKHHTLAHECFQQSTVTTNHATADMHIACNNILIPAALLATAVIKVQSSSGYELQLRALIDNGSEASFITEYAAQQLRVPRERTHVIIAGVGGTTVGKAKTVVDLQIKSIVFPDFTLKCRAFVLNRLGQLLPKSSISTDRFGNLKALSLADPEFYQPGSIDMILGADVYGSLLCEGFRRSNICTDVVAQNTRLGWLIFGRLPLATDTPKLTLCGMTAVELNDLVQGIWKFMEQKDIEGEQKLTQDELNCEKFYESTVRRTATGRYVVRYPFKTDVNLQALATSKSDALRLFRSQSILLSKDPNKHGLYENFMAEYLSLSHMELVRQNEEDTASIVCYIPHHGVIKETSTTTKMRTVFNASRTYPCGFSLNDCLHTGPKLQNDLTYILLRWRTHRIAFIANIEKCFRQILVDREDVDLQRIFWKDEKNRIASYRLLTVTYGLDCSPYLTVKTLHTLANDYANEMPAATKILRESFYVDDCLHGADCIDEARHIQRDLDILLRRGGFELRKWTSNSVEFLQHIKSDSYDEETPHLLNLDEETQALGVYWSCRKDFITYKVSLPPVLDDIKKRQQLSDIA